jgi:hypothetical protein
MAASAFRGAIDFFNRLGVYDVVLPFLLIYTVTFAVLEKSKIFGTEKVGKEEYTRKSVNAMVAFVIAFLLVASTKLVEILNASLAKVALLMMVSISFLILLGTFIGRDEEAKLEKGAWRNWGMAFMVVGVLLIFSYELGWLVPAWDYLMANWSGSVVGSIALLILVIWFMSYIGKPEKAEEKK